MASAMAKDRPQSSAPPRAEAAYQEALRDYAAGRFGQALETIGRASRGGGWTVALHSLAGWCHLRSGEIAAAETAFRAAADLEKTAVDPQVSLGVALLDQRKYADAGRIF